VNRVLTPSATALPRGTRETFWFSLQTFCITRTVITVLLLAYMKLNVGKDARALDAIVSWEAGTVYVVLAAGFALLSLYVRQRFMLQLVAQLTVDIVVISMLYVAAGGAGSGLAILYLFPLAGSAILAPLLLAFFFVSLVTLVLLGESSYQVMLSMSDVSTSQAGLYGAAFFTAVYMINRLAARLVKQEDLAASRGRDLRLQESINRLVVADMGDGVLVLGPNSEMFASNPAANRMLGLGWGMLEQHARLTGIAALAPIANAVDTWKAGDVDAKPGAAGATAYVMIKPDEAMARQAADRAEGAGVGFRRDLAAHLKLRFAKVETSDTQEDRTLVFMRDVSEIEDQAQQLKLASMGRLTGSIAHEVRNPLSAIAHATALLREDTAEPSHTRLLRIVEDNVVRLDRMIEDILKLSRKAHIPEAPLELGPALEEIVAEFREEYRIAPGLIALGEMDACRVRFDLLHLREVIVNLLSNALRYASAADASIRLNAVRLNAGGLELHVQDDGPPMAPQVRAHLFEPFYTTSSKGTGLGLYMARELCLNNGAMLDYEYRSDTAPYSGSSGRFVITFAHDHA
jgi:two-component system, NtrC family, sensor histidine kinase PilS